MSPEERSKQEAHFERETKAMARSGRYKVVREAEKYVESVIGRYWRPLLTLDRDASVVSCAGLTETQCLVLHLFGRGVLQKGRSEMPTVRTFVPVEDDMGNALYLRALPKATIADIIGRTRGQIEYAIDRLRGKTAHAERAHAVLLEHSLTFPLFVPTGIMLDVALSKQRVLAFEEPDYWFARNWARQCREDDATLQQKQVSHCDLRLALIKERAEAAIQRANEEARPHPTGALQEVRG